MNGDILVEKLLALKPFVLRNVSNFPFEFKLNEKVSVFTTIEVS